MTVQIKPEDEKLIAEKLRSGAFQSVEELIHRALVALPAQEEVFQKSKKNFYQLMRESPLVGLELNFGLDKEYPRPIEL